MKNQTRQVFARHKCDGFTLVELMIAIGVALILIIGVGYVFRKAGDTVSIGQALSTLARDNRALQASMNEDFEDFATDSPFLVILNAPKIGYIDIGDYQTDNGSANGGVFDPSQSGKYLTTSQALQVPTVHRHDLLGFFTRGKYTRRASAAGLTDTTGSVEAFVWYGMLAMLDNSYGTYWQPAQGGGNGNNVLSNPTDNPNNFYGTQWTLGRMCILLRPDAYNVDTITKGGYFPAGTSSNPLQPLQGGTFAYVNGRQTSIPIESNLIDLAETNIQTYNEVCSQAQTAAEGNVITWADPLISMPLPSVPSSSGAPTPFFGGVWETGAAQSSPTMRFFQGRTWAARPFMGKVSNGNTNAAQGNVYTPFDQSSQMAASLMPGVTQFIVEYAGDYLNQDPTTGKVINIWENGDYMGGGYVSAGWEQPLAGPTDGKLDFIVDPDGTHRMLWYGFPRDVAGNGVAYNQYRPATINSTSATNGPDSSIPTSYSFSANLGPCNNGQQCYPPQDVVPLRDLLQTCPQNASFAKNPQSGGGWRAVRAPFERAQVNGNLQGFEAQGPDYVTGLQTTGLVTPYCCVWGPSDRRPWLIRVTITVNDPNRAVRNGQTFDYIFNVPH